MQAAAVAAWSDDDARRSSAATIFAAKRAILRQAFDDAGLCAPLRLTAGLYMWIDVGDDLAVTDRLLEGGVVVSPGRFFGDGGEGYIRLALVPTRRRV